MAYRWILALLLVVLSSPALAAWTDGGTDVSLDAGETAVVPCNAGTQQCGIDLIQDADCGDPSATESRICADTDGTLHLNPTGATAESTILSSLILDTSLEVLNLVGDETGTGALVFANTPTLVTPAIGAATGASVVLSGDATAANFYSTGQTYYANAGGTVFWKAGTGSPEGAVTGGIGSLWSATNGTTDTTLWRKESGAGNTGWVAVTATGVAASLIQAGGERDLRYDATMECFYVDADQGSDHDAVWAEQCIDGTAYPTANDVRMTCNPASLDSGSTTDGIQECITALEGVGGGAVVLGPRIYEMTGDVPIKLDGDDTDEISIQGTGPGSVIRCDSGQGCTAEAAIDILSNSQEVRDVLIIVAKGASAIDGIRIGEPDIAQCTANQIPAECCSGAGAGTCNSGGLDYPRGTIINNAFIAGGFPGSAGSRLGVGIRNYGLATSISYTEIKWFQHGILLSGTDTGTSNSVRIDSNDIHILDYGITTTSDIYSTGTFQDYDNLVVSNNVIESIYNYGLNLTGNDANGGPGESVLVTGNRFEGMDTGILMTGMAGDDLSDASIVSISNFFSTTVDAGDVGAVSDAIVLTSDADSKLTSIGDRLNSTDCITHSGTGLVNHQSKVTGTDNQCVPDVSGGTAVLVDYDKLMNVVAGTGATDEYCLTYELTGTTLQWAACGGAETNTLSTLTTGIADDQLPVGTAADTVVYKTLTDCNAAGEALTYDTATNAWGCLTGLGAGGTVDSVAGDTGVTAGAAVSVLGSTDGIDSSVTGDILTLIIDETEITALNSMTSASTLAAVGTITSGTWSVSAGTVTTTAVRAATTGALELGNASNASVTIAADGTTDGDLVLPLTSVSGAEMVSDTVTATQLAATISPADGDLIDFGTNISSATEGLMIPAHLTSCASATAEGQVCWEEDANHLWIGDGAAAVDIGPGAGSGDITAVGPGYLSGDAWSDTVVSTGTVGLLWEGTTSNASQWTLNLPADPTTVSALTIPDATAAITMAAGTGTLIDTGDTGTVTATMVLDGTLVEADLTAAAETGTGVELVTGVAGTHPVTEMVCWNAAEDAISCAAGATMSTAGVFTLPSTGSVVIPGNTTVGQAILLHEDTNNTTSGAETWSIDIGATNLAATKTLAVDVNGEFDAATLLTDATVTSALIAVDTIAAVDIVTGGVATAEILDDTITASDLAATVTLADADLVSFASVSVTSATEGILLPQHATSCASSTAEGQVCWEVDANHLWIGDGAAAVDIGPGAGTGDVTAVGPGYASGDAWTDTVVSTGTVGLLWEGTTSNASQWTLNLPADPTTVSSLTITDATAAITMAAGTGTLIDTGDTGTVDSTMIATDTITASDLAATVTLADADLVSFASVSVTSATEGILLPQNATSCASATAEGQICWEADANHLWVGDGAAAVDVGPGAGSGDITDVGPGYASGAAWTDTVVSTGTIGLLWEGSTSNASQWTLNLPADPTTVSSLTIPDATAALTMPAGTDTLAGKATTDVFTNKTIDAEGTGNDITLTSKTWLPVAGCQNATASLLLDSPTTNAGAAACITGTNTQKGVADFDTTTSESLQTTLMLPAGSTAVVDVDYKWLAAATTGSVTWCTQLICVADAETDDPAFPAQATGNCVSDAAKGTTLQTNDATDTGITATGCAAGELMHVKISRDPASVSTLTDDMAGDARLIGVMVTTRRLQ